MSDLLMCVGGGGQHIALATARMVRLGVWANVPRVVVLDPERTAPLNVRLRTFAPPSRTPTPDTPTSGGKNHPFGSFVFDPPFDVLGLPPTFKDVFLEKRGGDLEEELYELFYPEMADKVDVHVGMFAQPAVGAAMFSSKAGPYLDPIITGAIASSEKLMVAGSLVGGTGAGMLHQLVDHLARHRQRGSKDIFGAFLLKWFNLPAGGAGAANDVTLINSANHGLDYLARHTHQRLRRTIVVGANKKGPALADANQGNDETVSIFPLLAAYGLTTIRSDTTSMDDHTVYGLTTPPDDPRCLWLLEERWESGAPGGTIGARWRAAQVVQRIVNLLRENRSDFDRLDGHGVSHKWFGWNWADAVKDAAKLASTTEAQLAPLVLDALGARLAEVEFVTSWLDQVFATPSLARHGNQTLMGLAAATLRKEDAYVQLEKSVTCGKDNAEKWLKSLQSKDGRNEALNPAAAATKVAAFIEEALFKSVGA